MVVFKPFRVGGMMHYGLVLCKLAVICLDPSGLCLTTGVPVGSMFNDGPTDPGEVTVTDADLLGTEEARTQNQTSRTGYGLKVLHQAVPGKEYRAGSMCSTRAGSVGWDSVIRDDSKRKCHRITAARRG